jgi:ribosomal protein L37AE/L43A
MNQEARKQHVCETCGDPAQVRLVIDDVTILWICHACLLIIVSLFPSAVIRAETAPTTPKKDYSLH